MSIIRKFLKGMNAFSTISNLEKIIRPESMNDLVKMPGEGDVYI
jgi:hypothetical protein